MIKDVSHFPEVIPQFVQTVLIWTLIWLSITHTSYAALDINCGHIMKKLGKGFYFYHRYAELVLHLLIGIT